MPQFNVCKEKIALLELQKLPRSIFLVFLVEMIAAM